MEFSGLLFIYNSNNLLTVKGTILHCKLLIITLLSLLYLSCAAPHGTWKGKVLHQQENLGKDRLAHGRSMLILPLITANGFDTTDKIMPAAHDAVKNSSDKELSTCLKSDLDSTYAKKYGVGIPESFYKKLLKNDILPIIASDSVWEILPCRYLLTVRIIGGMSIKTFEKKVKKKVSLEAEMWDSDNPGVVWRAQVYGYEIDGGRIDHDFIASGVKQILSMLPSFLPFSNEENW